MGAVGVGRRGRDPSREMHQLGAPEGDDRRRCGRADVRGVAGASPGRCTKLVHRQNTAEGGEGITEVGKRGRVPPGICPY